MVARKQSNMGKQRFAALVTVLEPNQELELRLVMHAEDQECRQFDKGQ